MAFQTKIKEQLVTDLRESQQEYNDAVILEEAAKVDYQRRKFLKENPKEVKSEEDRALCKKGLTWYKTEKDRLRGNRKTAKKDYDESIKALDGHKDEEANGFIRENDIQKIGNQYKANWTHLPKLVGNNSKLLVKNQKTFLAIFTIPNII